MFPHCFLALLVLVGFHEATTCSIVSASGKAYTVLSTTESDKQTAASACQAMGYELPSFHSTAEYKDFIVSLAGYGTPYGTRFWIGYTYGSATPDDTNAWSWDDGSANDWNIWTADNQAFAKRNRTTGDVIEPKPQRNGFCSRVSLTRRPDTARSVRCSLNKGATVCQCGSAPQPTCSISTDHGSYYLVSPAAVDKISAADACQSMSMELPYFSSASDLNSFSNALRVSQLDTRLFWLGIHYGGPDPNDRSLWVTDTDGSSLSWEIFTADDGAYAAANEPNPQRIAEGSYPGTCAFVNIGAKTSRAVRCDAQRAGTVCRCLNPPRNCSALSDCSGNGQCVEDGVCECYSGYAGANCGTSTISTTSTTVTVVPSACNPQQPTITCNSSLSFQESMVCLHNRWRQELCATNMKRLVWNDELAAVAQEWAEACYYGHRSLNNGSTSIPIYDDSIGENLARGTFGYYTAVDLATLWYNEIGNYDHSQCNDSAGGTCTAGYCEGVCGHYTQNVWAETEAIGCAFVECNPLYGYNENVDLGNQAHLVCNYAKAGNVHTGSPLQLKTPYLTDGDACSACQIGFECDSDFLCAKIP